MKHLLQHFKILTKHPQNAEELKGLILQLAVQGKLTENWRQDNPNMESATELLNQIEIEKDKLIVSKEIKKEKLEEIDDSTEFPFDIPECWKLVRLGNTMSIIRGVSFKKHEVSEVQTQGTIGVLRGQNMVNSEINKNKLIYLSREKVKNTQIISKGDIAITLSSGSDKLVGKIGLSSFDEEFTIGAFYGKLKVFKDETKFYILNYLDSPLYKNQLKGAFRGIGINNLSNSKVKNLIIPLPPTEEQKAIVAIVNELFKEVEQLEEQTKTRVQLKEDFVTSALQRLMETENINQEWQFLQSHFSEFFTEKENIKQLRESILQLAVQGKLTRTWRERHPELIEGQNHASELLKRIQEEKAQLIKDKKIKKEKALPPITEDEIPYDLPDGWVWCRMQEVGLFERGKSKHRPRNDGRLFNDGSYPLVQTGDVSSSKNTGGLITTNKSFYNEFGLAQSRMWKKGTLCITIAANIAETGFLDFDACFPDSVVGFTNLLDNDISLSKYVDCFITVTKSDLERYAPSTAQKNINLGILYQLIFPLPPLEEQKAIVEKVNSLMALCDSLEEHIEHSQNQIEQLMQSCLKEVFEGKNVVIA